MTVDATVRSRHRRLATRGGVLLALAILAALPAAGQLHPAGPEVSVNVRTEGDQEQVSIAASGGRALAVWLDGNRVVGRRLEQGVPVGAELALEDAQSGSTAPAVAALPAGGWLVAWVQAPLSDSAALLVRRVGADGSLPDEPRLVAAPGFAVSPPALAVDGEGRSVVVWRERREDSGLAARFFDRDGAPVGDPVRFATEPGGVGLPAVTATGSGFLVAWVEPTEEVRQLVAQVFDPTGNTPEPPRHLFLEGDAEPFDPVLAPTQGGGAVVAWIVRRPGRAPREPVEEAVLARLLGPTGRGLREPVRLDLDRTLEKRALHLAAIPGIGYVATWNGAAGGPGGVTGYGIAGRYLTPEAVPAGPERLLFTDEREAVFGHDLAGGSDGSLTAAWWSCRPQGFVQPIADPCAGGGDGSGFGVFVRRFETAAAGSLVLAPGPAVLGESGGAVSVTVERLGGTAGMVTAEVSTAELEDGADAGSDFEARFETLVWPDADRSPRTLTVPLVEDSRPEGDEAFVVELVHATGGARVGDPASVRFTIVDDDELLERLLDAPFTGGLDGSEVQCDFERLIGLHRRLRVLAPNTGKTTGINLSLSASGDFSGLAYSGNGPGTAEHHLASSTNPEATTLLRNPARPQLPTVGFTRNRLASDLVEPGAADLLRLVLDPTLESNQAPPPAAFLRVDNLERDAGGRPSDAKPGRGLLALSTACHGRLGRGSERVLQVLQRIVRAETPGAARHEISIHPGPERDLYRVVVRPFDAGGAGLGSVTAEVEARFVAPVNPAEDPSLVDGVLRVPPACPPIDPPIGGTVCHTPLEPTTIHLVRPTFSGELWEPTPYRVTTGPGEVTVEVDFGDLLPDPWTSVSQF